MEQLALWLAMPNGRPQRLAQFKRPGYRTLRFGNQLRLTLTHKESSGNEGHHGHEQESDYHPTLQSFERVA